MNNISPRQIGKFISKLRAKRGWTQGAFAEVLGTSQSAVARMESGEQNLSTEMLEKIGKVFGRGLVRLADESVSFKIHGGNKLKGAVVTNTSKNAAIAVLSACLINKGKTTIRNVPKIEEVNRILEVLKSLGAVATWLSETDLEINAKNINPSKVDFEAATKTRAALLMIGALLGRFNKFSWPLTGGCKLGARTVRPHMYALENFGAKIKTIHDRYEILLESFHPAEFVLYETGDTVTENALIAAAQIPGKSVIRLASANYMVQDLCGFLKTLGVVIEGVGTPTLTVIGKKEINENIEYCLSEDPIESMFFLSVAATTDSPIIIKRCPIDFLRLELDKLGKMGMRFKISKIYKSKNGFTDLVDIQVVSAKNLKALEEKIHPLPSNQGVNIDNLPFFVPIATQAEGETLIHDWVYEDRSIYYFDLSKLRANVKILDPHRVIIKGKTELKPAEIVCPPALRPAAIILVAMLAAKGTSILRNVYSISRGYEDLARRLNKLGAKIEII